MSDFSHYKDDERVSCHGAARILGVSESTVARYREEGKLAFFQYSPRKIVYRVGDLRQFIQKSYFTPEDTENKL